MPLPCAIARCVVMAVVCVVSAGVCRSGRTQEPLPLPAEAVPGAMYIGDSVGDDAMSGMPRAMAVEMLPEWPRWFAGASGLIMTRTLDQGTATMQPLGSTQLFTGDAGATWPGGIDLHIGRWFGPRQHHAVEFIYWGVYGIGSSAAATSSPPGSITAIPQAVDVTVAGRPARDYLVGASRQVVSRSDLVNDVEINWVYALWDRPEFLPRERAVSVMWLAGFRFFQIEDVLTLTNTAGGVVPGSADLEVDTNNNLYGGQIGAKFDWRFLPSVRFTAVPKFMLAGNAITNSTTLSSSSGAIATFDDDGSAVSVHSTLGVFSWLGSIDTGLAWDVTEHWTLSLGYRVVGVGNIAQADGQWPVLIDTPASITGVTAGGSTFVHGAYAGFESRY